MKKLFIPKDIEKKAELLKERRLKEEEYKEMRSDNLLVFASTSKVFVLPEYESNPYIVYEEPIEIAERKGHLWDLCFHDGKLYDSAGSNVYETLTNDCVAQRPSNVHGLTSDGDKMFDSGYYGTIYETLNDKFVNNAPHWVYSMCWHCDDFYYYSMSPASGSGIYKAKDMSLIKTKPLVWALCSYNGNLYDAGNTNVVHETFDDKIISERDYNILSMCEHNGKLLDGCADGTITNSFTGEEICNFRHQIFAMVSVPTKYLEDLL